jgi:hypothetical protein
MLKKTFVSLLFFVLFLDTTFAEKSTIQSPNPDFVGPIQTSCDDIRGSCLVACPYDNQFCKDTCDANYYSCQFCTPPQSEGRLQLCSECKMISTPYRGTFNPRCFVYCLFGDNKDKIYDCENFRNSED